MAELDVRWGCWRFYCFLLPWQQYGSVASQQWLFIVANSDSFCSKQLSDQNANIRCKCPLIVQRSISHWYDSHFWTHFVNDSTIMREQAVLCLGPIQSWQTHIHFVFVFDFVPVFVFSIVSLVFVFVFHFAFLFVFAIVFERMDVNPWCCITSSLSLTLQLCFFLLWLCVCACLWHCACLWLFACL